MIQLTKDYSMSGSHKNLILWERTEEFENGVLIAKTKKVGYYSDVKRIYEVILSRNVICYAEKSNEENEQLEDLKNLVEQLENLRNDIFERLDEGFFN